MTKGQELYERVEALIASGVDKSDAFRQAASEAGRPYNSVRGTYYAYKRKIEGGATRPRRRETTPSHAIADARAALERSIAAIDREVEVAQERAAVAAAEYEDIRGSADQRKAEISERMEALT
jgi:hypothetical protein